MCFMNMSFNIFGNLRLNIIYKLNICSVDRCSEFDVL